MDNNLFTATSIMAATHEHRPTIIKRYYNDRYSIIVYCTECHRQISSFMEQLNNEEECPIGATDSTGIS